MAHLRRDAHRYRDVAHSSPKQTPRYQSRVPLSEAISTREALMEKNLKLRIELRALSRRERLEPYATQQLGMAAIRPDQILIVRRPKPSDAPVGQTDGLCNIRRNAD